MQFAVLLSVTFQLMVRPALSLTIIEQLKTAGNVEQFLALVYKDGRPMTTDDVYPFASSNNLSTGEKEYVSLGSVLALPDECSVRMTSMVIPRAVYDPAEYIYWPECTMIKKCGGCCSSERLQCVPKISRMLTLHVIRTLAKEEGSMHLEWVGLLPVVIEEHLECHVTCKLNPLDCEVFQSFIPEECQCVCIYRDECTPQQVWDSEQCRCKCFHAGNCGPNTLYDHSQCRCVISEEQQEVNIAISSDLSQAEIDQYLQQQNEVAETTEAPTTSTTPTTTPTTTTVPLSVATHDVCASTQCPPRWRKIRRHGRCRCTPHFA